MPSSRSSRSPCGALLLTRYANTARFSYASFYLFLWPRNSGNPGSLWLLQNIRMSFGAGLMVLCPTHRVDMSKTCPRPLTTLPSSLTTLPMPLTTRPSLLRFPTTLVTISRTVISNTTILFARLLLLLMSAQLPLCRTSSAAWGQLPGKLLEVLVG